MRIMLLLLLGRGKTAPLISAELRYYRHEIVALHAVDAEN